MSDKIFFTPVTIKNQFPTQIEKENCYIELFDNYLEFSADFIADEPKDAEDKSLGLTQTINFFKIVAVKGRIAGVEYSLTISGKRYVLVIMVTGFSEDIKVYYKEKMDGMEVYNKIKNWLLQ